MLFVVPISLHLFLWLFAAVMAVRVGAAVLQWWDERHVRFALRHAARLRREAEDDFQFDWRDY